MHMPCPPDLDRWLAEHCPGAPLADVLEALLREQGDDRAGAWIAWLIAYGVPPEVWGPLREQYCQECDRLLTGARMAEWGKNRQANEESPRYQSRCSFFDGVESAWERYVRSVIGSLRRCGASPGGVPVASSGTRRRSRSADCAVGRRSSTSAKAR